MAGPAFPCDDDDASGALVAKGAAGDNSRPLTISQISQALKRSVEERFGFVRLRGELSGVKRAASGHLYCSLKDEGAVIDAVMWKGQAARLGFRPEDGIEVIASGKLTIYPGRSKYQIVIEQMELAGEGALFALLEKTRVRLAAEGLFAPERKRKLPFAPRVIGVVTSPTGAVIRDILHRLADRFPCHVLVWPVLVQGPGAAGQVAAALRGFAMLEADGAIPRPDLLIVARGGGSIEDLWAFNEEEVVRAIAASPIPVISAVGHETDTTLADHAADWRAPTPTAAAEAAVPVRRELAHLLADLARRQARAALRPVELGAERLAQRAARLPGPAQLLQQATQRHDDLAERLRRGLRQRASAARERLGAFRLSPAILRAVARAAGRDLAAARFGPDLLLRPQAQRAEQLAAIERLRRQLDPRAPLARGYALVSAAGVGVVASRAEAARHKVLSLEFADGVIDAAPTALAPSGKVARQPTPAPDLPPAQPKLL